MNKPIKSLSKTPTFGFTLIEMTIVVLIMAILAAEAVPAYLGLRTRVVLRSSAELMLGALAEGRLQAIKENRRVTIDFAPLLTSIGTQSTVSGNNLGTIIIEPRLATLTDPTAAGSVDFSRDGYKIRFGVTAIGQGYICVPATFKSPGYSAC